MKHILLIVLLGASLICDGANETLPQLRRRPTNAAKRQSKPGRLRTKSIETARTERDKLNAFVVSEPTGSRYVCPHVRKDRSETTPIPIHRSAKDFGTRHHTDDKFISGILDQIGSYTLAFPLAPRT